MTQRLVDRRQFAARGAAFGLAALAGAAARAEGAAPGAQGRTVKFPDGTGVPAIGQGSASLGLGKHPAATEEEALRLGLSLGMGSIDTSGNYGGGRSEELIGRAIAGARERVFLVSKVEADEVGGDGIARACAASLRRLGTDHLDLYLMHWPVPTRQFAGMVAAFERLRAAKRIRAWGVSNFGVRQMDDLMRVPDGARCATNQVPYSLADRAVERDLLAWCRQHGMPVMAYSPLGGPGNLVIRDRTLAAIGAAHGASAAAVALAWAVRDGNVLAIPESGNPAHVRENAAALSLALTPQDLAALDAAFPGRGRAR